MAITNFEASGSPFVYGGDSITEAAYATATLATFMNPKYVGQIVAGTTTATGDDTTTTTIKDEKGNAITSKVTAGTTGFSMEIASTSDAILTKFMKAAAITGTTFTSGTTFASGATAIGWGVDLPLFVAPFGIVNRDKTVTMMYPKCTCVSKVAMSADGLYTVKATVTIENIDTAALKPMMKVTGTIN